MNCTFYLMTENRNKINKVLENGTVKNLTFRNNFDVENPTLFLSFDPIANGFNYVEIDAKYYFIDSVDFVRYNYYRVNLTLDVLKTYASAIAICKCTIIESENPTPNKIDCVMGDDFNIKTLALTDVFDRNGKIYLTTVFKGV